jgi:putative transposase
MSFRLVEAEKAQHRVSRLCSALGVTRAGYYRWAARRPSARELADRELTRLIAAVFAESRETYGAPRVHLELRDQGMRVGRKRVARLMRQAGLQGVSRRGRRRRTPASEATSAPAPDPRPPTLQSGATR